MTWSGVTFSMQTAWLYIYFYSTRAHDAFLLQSQTKLVCHLLENELGVTEKRQCLLEALGGEEVKQMEQLLQVVLQGSSSEQQLVVDLIPVEDSKKLNWSKSDSNANFLLPKLTVFISWFICRFGSQHTQQLFTFDWLFFSLWASSTTRQAQVTEPRMAWSIVMSS